MSIETVQHGACLRHAPVQNRLIREYMALASLVWRSRGWERSEGVATSVHCMSVLVCRAKAKAHKLEHAGSGKRKWATDVSSREQARREMESVFGVWLGGLTAAVTSRVDDGCHDERRWVGPTMARGEQGALLQYLPTESKHWGGHKWLRDCTS